MRTSIYKKNVNILTQGETLLWSSHLLKDNFVPIKIQNIENNKNITRLSNKATFYTPYTGLYILFSNVEVNTSYRRQYLCLSVCLYVCNSATNQGLHLHYKYMCKIFFFKSNLQIKNGGRTIILSIKKIQMGKGL